MGDKTRNSDNEDMWKLFGGDKSKTLGELLDSTPEAMQLKKQKFDINATTSIGDESSFSRRKGRRRAILPSKISMANLPSSSISDFNLGSSNLALLDSSSPIEPTQRYGKKKIKKLRKLEREKTKGPGWFNLPAAEMTDERKNDIDALQLRGALDTKRFYKRNNLPTRPKYFQVGRIMDNPVDFYHSRIPRKQRKRTIAEEMMVELNNLKNL